MKKLNVLTLSVAVGAWLAAPALQAGIVGSPHDFSGESWNISPSDPNSVCGPCHQAHHAANNVVPLWGHTTSTGPWTMYSRQGVAGSKLDATIDPTPTGPSLACLSCHDGTVAVNSYGGQVQGGSPVTITNRAMIGTDLTHSHPISFTYDANLAVKDQWIYNPDDHNVLVPSTGTFVPGNDMTINGFLLGGNNRVECSSCHDVHNQEGSPFSIATNPKLVKIVGTQGGRGSLLCRSCHNK
jgi:hypothetical protein